MASEQTHMITGDPVNRVDGRLKVTGKATYAAEHDIPGITYGVLVTSTIAKGTIQRIDTKAAEKAPGVIAVITHLNAPKVPGYETTGKDTRVEGQAFRVFYNNEILFNGQPVALAIADSFERARYAASLVQVAYSKEAVATDLHARLDKAVKPARDKKANYIRGNAAALSQAAFTSTQQYTTPLNVHNPMEPHAAIIVWEGDEKVTVYNKTQSVEMAQKDIMNAFHLKEENVQVYCKWAGGAFGGASRIWPGEMAALIGAKKTGKPLKLALNRDQLFNMVGYRPASVQKLTLGAAQDGMLTGIQHDAWGGTSSYEQFPERLVDVTRKMYQCANVQTNYKLVPLQVSTPCWTRGPGESTGSFALESAIDELSERLQMDPLEFRRKNYAATDQDQHLPWSSKHLDECYTRGAARFGWQSRNPQPRSMREGEWLAGMGMSSGCYHSRRSPATVKAVLSANGSLLVQTATADVGVGTATVMSQIAADAIQLPLDKIVFEWGDSSLPPSPGQFGSITTVSVGGAVNEVCKALKDKLLSLAVTAHLVEQDQLTTLVIENGVVRPKKGESFTYTEVLQQQQLPELAVTKESKGGPALEQYSGSSFCASFVKVLVHPLTGQVKVTKVVSAVDAGTIVNAKTARSQVYGSVVWGIGMALMEASVIDHRYGRWMVKDLADYHVPVQADIPDIDVIFIDKADPVLNAVGTKGLGEIGLVGFAGALANAVYHATGIRVRDLPITPDKLVS